MPVVAAGAVDEGKRASGDRTGAPLFLHLHRASSDSPLNAASKLDRSRRRLVTNAHSRSAQQWRIVKSPCPRQRSTAIAVATLLVLPTASFLML